MKRSIWQVALSSVRVLAVAFVAAAICGAAAPPKANIAYVFPAGGRQGSTFEVKLAGTRLDGVTNVVVSGGGVKGTLVEHVKPLSGKDRNLLRDRLKKLPAEIKKANQSKAPNLATLQKEMAEVRNTLANPKNNPVVRRNNPGLIEDLVLRITVAPNAKAGKRELRIKTARGLSNPVVFHVGGLPEYTEKELKTNTKNVEQLPQLPLIINGRIMPGDVDRFRLKLKKGTQLVMSASARELIPYLADAVPGWFQATLGLYDAGGKELAYADDYRFNPDPTLFYEIDKDGEYVLAIKDAIYRGREDFVYRIAVGELPFVTSVFPMGGQVDTQTTVQMIGWNLPNDELTMDTRRKLPGILPVSVRKERMISNNMPFAVGTLPERMEREPNNRKTIAHKVVPALVLNGRIDKPGDIDVFRIEGRKGEAIVAEVYARRLNSPLDSTLKLTDADGKTIKANDDHEDRSAGLTTHQADSLISTTLPADGTYYLHLGDAQQKGGQAYTYRLRISGPQPDFDLRVVPSSLSARGNTTIPITVYALRKDGFAGEITVSLKGAPQGFVLTGTKIPADKEQVEMKLKVPWNASREPMTLRLEGRGKIAGKQVVRPAIPAEDMMQAFLYRHLVPSQDLKLVVLGPPPKKPAPKKAPVKRPPIKSAKAR
ncbi:MAG: PPC domain-containing protein [Planctomycetes bacterium]|nr:PPC domain-containing protein [Planctomycetota bacterium]